MYKYLYDSNTDSYICLEEGETCESRSYYQIKDSDVSKQCYNSLVDCKSNGLKIFNKECYLSCPNNTIEDENDASICKCENYFFYSAESGVYYCFNSDVICITANEEYQYTNNETKECFKTENDCLQKSPEENCKYYTDCNPAKDYMFNGTCYKDQCPEGTKLDESNPSSRNCIFVVNTNIISTNNNEIITTEIKSSSAEVNLVSTNNNEIITTEIKSSSVEVNPISTNNNEIITTNIKTSYIEINKETNIHNNEQCRYLYRGNCVSQCPENTCLDPNMDELFKCIDPPENTKIINMICIQGIDEMLSNVIENSDIKNIEPIITPSGTTINIVPAEISTEVLNEKYPEITTVDLGECGEKLKSEYNQDLYILGIDSPNLYGNSSINEFNYEIYLKNGTQIQDLNKICQDNKIITSSNINDLNIIKFEKAVEFSKNGYDIYNKSDKFYVDNCAPANDNGNDITLEDRATYYYPNVSICNEGCNYKSISYNSQRFVCECDIEVNSNNTSNIENNEKEEQDQTYLEYFLSLINYKIIKCYSLIKDYQSFYYNGGLYIGFFSFFISIILIFVFCLKTTKTIKIYLFKNFPSNEKLKETIRSNLKRRTIRINNETNNSNFNPPKKNNQNKNKKVINILALNMGKENKLKHSKYLKYENINSKNKLHKVRGIKSKTKIQKFVKKNPNKENNIINNNEKDESNSIMKFKSPKVPQKKRKNSLPYFSLLNKQKASKNKNGYTTKHNENNDELKLDLNFSRLIDINDEEIEERELNEVPFQQALRIDDRNFFEILLSILLNKIGLLNLFCNRSPYIHLSLTISIYLFELLLDLTLNCFLYTDDVVSEKYHNNGSLSMFTSFSLSIISNIISSIFCAIISNLADYSEIFESIIINVKNKTKYLENIIRFLKYIRIRLSCFYILEIIFTIIMTYYLFIFCTVYHQSQTSILINYIIGAVTSLAFSIGITIIITILRIISIKYHSSALYNTSRYIFKKF